MMITVENMPKAARKKRKRQPHQGRLLKKKPPENKAMKRVPENKGKMA